MAIQKTPRGPRGTFFSRARGYMLLIFILMHMHVHVQVHIQHTRAHVTLRGWHLAPTRGVVDFHTGSL